MSGTILIMLAATAFAAAALITGWLRGYAVKRSLVDHPNSRSAHDVPVPRGGGVSIVIAFIGSLTVLAGIGAVELSHSVAVGGAGLVVGLVGFIDDHGHVAARWRLMAHFAAAAWLLAWIGGVPAHELLVERGIPAPVVYAAAALLIVWLINLYNFMDGIDGIASVETIAVTIGGATAAVLSGHPELAPLQILLAASVWGFLVWNWPPATIFMGDIGSGFLGVVIAAMILLSAQSEPALAIVWLILLAVFLVDSGLTLVRRAARGERIYEAHTMHAYQHAVRRVGSHAKVTSTVAAINLLWLFPIAIAVAVGRIPAVMAVVAAYLPLAALAWWWRAGCPIESTPVVRIDGRGG